MRGDCGHGPHPLWRWTLRLVLIGLVLVVAVALSTAWLFVWPPTGTVDRVDAVIVLAGDHGERLDRALTLVHAGVSSTLVLDGEPDSQHVLDLCDGSAGQTFEVVCLRPDPDSTRYEARAAAALAEERKWTRVAVVTTTAHLTRSGVLFDRCLDASVVMVEGRRRPDFSFLMHEWLGLGHALLVERDC